MKIKTITCHDVYNVGASLQAYALMTYLSEQGNDVEIIDYKPDYLSHHYQFFYVDNPAYRKNIYTKLLYVIVKLPKKIRQQKRKIIFDSFTNKYLNLTKRYKSIEELREDCPMADVFIAGSDQIWNPLFPNGKDPAFYLEFAPETAIKASYAASFAVDRFPDDSTEFISKLLARLDCISVREKSGLSVLKQLGIVFGCEVLDPVFLLNKDCWSKLAGTEVLLQDRYILVYDFEKSEMIRTIVKKIARNNDLRIVTIFKSDYSDINYIDVGPLEFLNLIKNAEYVISNSFHATAFSIIFEKNFYTIGRKENVNSRMVDLLNKIGLDTRYITVDDNTIPVDIDYSLVREQLNHYIEISKDYLKNILEKRSTMKSQP